MRSGSRLRVLYSVPLLGMVLFIFSIGFPPFDDATTLDLTTHMIQHIVIVMAGVMIAYPLHRKGYFTWIESKTSAYASLAVIIVLITFWHLPTPWDSAVLNPVIHAGEHFSFLLVGILIGSTMQLLSDRAKIDILALGFFGHFGYGLILISQYRIYPLYSLADQGVLGIVMFGVGPFYWTGILYLIFRNRHWFREVPSFGDEPRPEIPRSRDPDFGTTTPYSSNLRSIRLVTPILTVALVAALILFYSSSVVAISFMPPQTQTGSSAKVLIIETPVTWAYSPQNLTVVIGVNNTVIWVSHSISYDTVTSADGSFDSGAIAPGQSFTHTFATPGEYAYLCVYHPWMVGNVRVLPAAR